jgi:hypothetical protein
MQDEIAEEVDFPHLDRSRLLFRSLPFRRQEAQTQRRVVQLGIGNHHAERFLDLVGSASGIRAGGGLAVLATFFSAAVATAPPSSANGGGNFLPSWPADTAGLLAPRRGAGKFLPSLRSLWIVVWLTPSALAMARWLASTAGSGSAAGFGCATGVANLPPPSRPGFARCGSSSCSFPSSTGAAAHPGAVCP